MCKKILNDAKKNNFLTLGKEKMSNYSNCVFSNLGHIEGGGDIGFSRDLFKIKIKNIIITLYIYIYNLIDASQ